MFIATCRSQHRRKSSRLFPLGADSNRTLVSEASEAGKERSLARLCLLRIGLRLYRAMPMLGFPSLTNWCPDIPLKIVELHQLPSRGQDRLHPIHVAKDIPRLDHTWEEKKERHPDSTDLDLLSVLRKRIPHLLHPSRRIATPKASQLVLFAAERHLISVPGGQEDRVWVNR